MATPTKKTASSAKTSAEKKPAGAARKTAGASKPKAHKATEAKEKESKEVLEEVEAVLETVASIPMEKMPGVELPKSNGKYFFATGRRKTSVANVRLFFGASKSTVNGKEFKTYFGTSRFVDEAFKPLQLTGLEGKVYVFVNTKGGGTHSQAQAISHGIAQALVISTPDFRKVLKKNGMLTRDDRKKERK